MSLIVRPYVPPAASTSTGKRKRPSGSPAGKAKSRPRKRSRSKASSAAFAALRQPSPLAAAQSSSDEGEDDRLNAALAVDSKFGLSAATSIRRPPAPAQPVSAGPALDPVHARTGAISPVSLASSLSETVPAAAARPAFARADRSLIDVRLSSPSSGSELDHAQPSPAKKLQQQQHKQSRVSPSRLFSYGSPVHSRDGTLAATTTANGPDADQIVPLEVQSSPRKKQPIRSQPPTLPAMPSSSKTKSPSASKRKPIVPPLQRTRATAPLPPTPSATLEEDIKPSPSALAISLGSSSKAKPTTERYKPVASAALPASGRPKPISIPSDSSSDDSDAAPVISKVVVPKTVPIVKPSSVVVQVSKPVATTARAGLPKPSPAKVDAVRKVAVGTSKPVTVAKQVQAKVVPQPIASKPVTASPAVSRPAASEPEVIISPISEASKQIKAEPSSSRRPIKGKAKAKVVPVPAGWSSRGKLVQVSIPSDSDSDLEPAPVQVKSTPRPSTVHVATVPASAPAQRSLWKPAGLRTGLATQSAEIVQTVQTPITPTIMKPMSIVSASAPPSLKVLAYIPPPPAPDLLPADVLHQWSAYHRHPKTSKLGRELLEFAFSQDRASLQELSRNPLELFALGAPRLSHLRKDVANARPPRPTPNWKHAADGTKAKLNGQEIEWDDFVKSQENGQNGIRDQAAPFLALEVVGSKQGSLSRVLTPETVLDRCRASGWPEMYSTYGSPADGVTSVHMDHLLFGYVLHILWGTKIWFSWAPTPANLEKHFTGSSNLMEEVKSLEGLSVTIMEQGRTYRMPPGTLHLVVSLTDSAVCGFPCFASRDSLATQTLALWRVERIRKLAELDPGAFDEPFEKLHAERVCRERLA